MQTIGLLLLNNATLAACSRTSGETDPLVCNAAAAACSRALPTINALKRIYLNCNARLAAISAQKLNVHPHTVVRACSHHHSITGAHWR